MSAQRSFAAKQNNADIVHVNTRHADGTPSIKRYCCHTGNVHDFQYVEIEYTQPAEYGSKRIYTVHTRNHIELYSGACKSTHVCHAGPATQTANVIKLVWMYLAIRFHT